MVVTASCSKRLLQTRISHAALRRRARWLLAVGLCLRGL